ncbi:Coatomer subunit delta-1 [Babesia sp. Xinjiang]|uniref:Coatomer subunit delta-1 n=1 Tax=Babesia sp. Xinjiang TaxID=462227 RepID=UPI000A24DB3D|nr:Coatomer subunit delta-1 [Babesia sp. Xinjiang]ORM41467.1 Coatomer subunit delta-1 [Babesia sp. Xinjiang]
MPSRLPTTHSGECTKHKESASLYFKMAILSTGIASKKRVLLSRQHREVKKAELETALSNFNRLVEKQSGDHTFVETEDNRFVYQPVDEYYVFVMTSFDSNILRDIGVVKALAEIVQSDASEGLQENLFELIFYMDELITDNKPEELTLDQIKEYILMDSQEEKKHNMIQTSKEKEEKERRKQIAAKLEKRKQLDHNFTQIVSETSVYGTLAADEPRAPSLMAGTSIPSGMKLSIHRMSRYLSLDKRTQINNRSSPLGLDAMRHATVPKASRDEGSINILDAEAPVVVQIVEVCSGSIHLEGGELVMTVFEESARLAALEFSANPEMKLRFHPIIDKNRTSKNVVELQNPQQEHKIGHSVSLVKWRHKTSDEHFFPITVSCWPNTNAGRTTVTVEILNSSDALLGKVNFQVLDSRYNQIVVNSNELGVVERNMDSLNWVVENFESQQTGRFEFTTNGDLNSILPFTLLAKAATSAARIKILRCYDKNTGDPLDHVVKTQTSFSMTIGSEGN